MGRVLAVIGMVLSFMYLSLVLWLFSGKFSMISEMRLNEVGDFFAGIFGPLAVLWLILGFFQQGIELRQQAIELKTSVEQQGELVGISKDQLNMAKSNAELEHERLEAALEPKFSLDYREEDTIGTTVNFFLRLTNGGHTVTCLRLALDDQHLETVPMLPLGQSMDVNFQLQEPERKVTKRLTVEYLNGLEKTKFKLFEIYLYRGLSGDWDVRPFVSQGVTISSLEAESRRTIGLE